MLITYYKKQTTLIFHIRKISAIHSFINIVKEIEPKQEFLSLISFAYYLNFTRFRVFQFLTNV